MTPDKIQSEKAVLIFLLVLALFIRTWGINFGLPFILHVDEARFAQISIDYFSKGLNPHFFHVPTLYTYLVAGLWAAYYGGGRISGQFPTRAEFIAHFNQDPTVFYILGRALTLLLSVGTILLVYFIGKKMFDSRVGFLAALFLVFSPEHNKISHYMNPDSPMVFFLALSFLFIWFIYTRGERKYYLLAGLAAGLATATKYGGQILFLPLFLAHVFYILENKLPLRKIIFSSDLILSGIAFLAAFFAGCPYAVLDFPTFWRDFRWQSRHLYSAGHFGDSTADPAWLFYLKYGFRENIGKLAQFLVLGGIIFGLARHRKKDLILLSYPLILFIIIGTWKTRATRYMLPLTPFFILIAAVFLGAFLTWLKTVFFRPMTKIKLRPLGEKALAGAVVLLFLYAPGYKIAMFDYTLTQKDTRIIAKEWVEKNIPKGTRIARESYCPPLPEKDYELFYKHSLSQIDLKWLSLKKIRYVITSDAMSARFTRFPKEFPREAAFYRSLDKNAVLIRSFEPAWDEYKNDPALTDLHNPTINIYRMSDGPPVKE
jgi:4-amino-4-deoxy-L-arabinose transferase-like glycosyltransferase